MSLCVFLAALRRQCCTLRLSFCSPLIVSCCLQPHKPGRLVVAVLPVLRRCPLQFVASCGPRCPVLVPCCLHPHKPCAACAARAVSPATLPLVMALPRVPRKPVFGPCCLHSHTPCAACAARTVTLRRAACNGPVLAVVAARSSYPVACTLASLCCLS